MQFPCFHTTNRLSDTWPGRCGTELGRWVLLILGPVSVFAGCGGGKNPLTDVRPAETEESATRSVDHQPAPYLGAAACRDCHPEKHSSFCETAHHLTSQPVTAKTVLGKFPATMKTSNAQLTFELEALPGGFFQTARGIRGQSLESRSERMDLILGSGKLGQSYLYWKENRLRDELYQLPISYITPTGGWQNSPGYTDGEVDFDRAIKPRCLECHATYFETLDPDNHASNAYQRTNFVLGISCERCHGAGGEHVKFHRDNPNDTTPHAMINPNHLSRDRQIDMCSLCHSGAGEPLQPSFTYRPGTSLAEYLKTKSLSEQNKIGVHSSNQIARLSQSKCFQNSPEMTCTTCHDPHELERGNLRLFSQRCLTCHTRPECGQSTKLGDSIATNCIDCHVPKLQDKETPFETPNGVRYVEMRDHFIGIYADQTNQFYQQRRSAHVKPKHGN